MTDIERIPTFCTECGKALKPGTHRLHAFDPYTGKRQARKTLVCPERKGRKYSEHDRWEKGDGNVNPDQWERSDG